MLTTICQVIGETACMGRRGEIATFLLVMTHPLLRLNDVLMI